MGSRQSLIQVTMLFAVLVTAIGCSKEKEGSSPGPSSPGAGKSEPKGSIPSGPVEYSLAATDFVNEMRKDQNAAAAKYQGKWVEVSGKVSFIGDYDAREQARTMGLESKDGAEHTLYCDMVQSERSPGKFSKGQAIRAKFLVGRPYGNSLKLTQGEVLELGPSNFVKLTAQDLGKEFLASAEAAQAKYKNRSIQLAATVEKLEVRGISLNTEPGIRIVCDTNFDPDPLAKDLKPGDTVTLVGIISTYFDKKITFYNYEVVPMK